MRPLSPSDPSTIGPYRLLGALGEGGMGRVYLGRSRGGMLVAVKVVRDDIADQAEFRARFAREAALARRVSGAFTAPVVDADTDGPRPWLATSYVTGPTLAEAVRRTGPLPDPVFRRTAAGLVEALASVHRAGLLHRDLKPGNIILSADGPRIIDFGIARALEGTVLTRTGEGLGTPGFMAPEQALGTEVTDRTDVFALGAVLAFAAAGPPGPFGAGSAASVLYRVARGEPDLSGVPERYQALIRPCLHKAPAQRPDLDSLLDAVHALAPADPDPEPAPAHPAGAGIGALIADHERQIADLGRNTPPAAARPGRRRGMWTMAGAGLAAVALLAAGGIAVLARDDTPPDAEATAPTVPPAPTDEPGEALPMPTFTETGTLPLINEGVQGRVAYVDDLRFAPDGDVLLVAESTVGPSDGRSAVRVVDPATGRATYQLAPDPGTQAFDGMGFTPDGLLGVVWKRPSLGPNDSRIVYYDAGDIAGGAPESGRARLESSLFALSDFHPDRGVALIDSNRGGPRLMDQEGRPVTGALPITSGHFSPDGDVLVGPDDGTSVLVWPVDDVLSAEGPPAEATVLEHETAVASVAVQPGGTLVATSTGDGDGQVTLWDRESGERIHDLDVGGGPHLIGFHPDGRILFLRGVDGVLRLYDVSARAGIGAIDGPAVTGETETSFDRFAVSPDGAYLAVHDVENDAVRVWEVR
ncbi:WD40 repeat domain-containing serine/threonine protein kinase [Marinactinospora rubrisoli]|uniref:WD40 repeat domain-containing serine/threonine protein kinase n=1 Tax=Marinactinospora rubrisoli TaxID=2715399 RepID=A0ABW2KIW9_9ACTN